jgi:hypothetical protein
MSYQFNEKNFVKKLSKVVDYPYLNELFCELKSEENVIEVGFWIKDITDDT